MAVLLMALPAWSQTDEPEIIQLDECLVIERTEQPRRSAVHLDAIEAQIVAGTWVAPSQGTTVATVSSEPHTWTAAKANDKGWFNAPALGHGYAFITVESRTDRIALLEARAHSLVYVNGEPRAGDPYRYGFVRLPIHLNQGTNELLFVCSRGALWARLLSPKAPVFLDTADTTTPDLITGQAADTWAAVVVVNATAEPLTGMVLSARIAPAVDPAEKDADNTDNETADREPATLTPCPVIAPLSIRKVPFQIAASGQAADASVQIELTLIQETDHASTALDSATIPLRVRGPEQLRKQTFVSRIDGSVQYYAVRPARPVGDDPVTSALFLTLHGAGVEALGQAASYSAKSWGHIVAPTNRRSYGFDWEDWGRMDALEVLELAVRELDADPSRIYLTGHSMGGHGTWSLGATFAHRFAAIGPSAGWISFWSYAGAAEYEDGSPMESILRRSTASSDPLAISANYTAHGIYILHGDADDNVEVKHARTMATHLAEFHRDFVLHEEPGKGHWWDSSDEPGAGCVDWAPMFDFFARHARPPTAAVRHVDFTTVNPAVSANAHWVTIEAQIKHLTPSTVKVRFDPHQRRFVGTTDNVSRLVFDLTHLEPGSPVTVQLDGQQVAEVPWPGAEPKIHLARTAATWSVVGRLPRSHKGPHRGGPFKQVFTNRFMFVYGTQGTPEEKVWALAKARFDAETFWYRGNGSVDVIPDHAFNAKADPDRNVVLYGNADTNSAWSSLMAASPVQIRRGLVTVGQDRLGGADSGCLLIRPRPNSDIALVGVVGGSGIAGMRLTDRLPYFVSGIDYPDILVLGPEVLTHGTAGIRTAGFFGPDWGVASGDIVWADRAPPVDPR